MPDESADSILLLGENRRHLGFIQMIQHSLHQQMHAVSHAAERQGYGAAGTVHIVGEVGGDGADGQQIFRGIGEQGFRVDARADAEKLAVAFWWFGVGWREVMVEGALGGFVEFV
ncbi:hypothetical protein D3C81_1954570 [compost metagenome]